MSAANLLPLALERLLKTTGDPRHLEAAVAALERASATDHPKTNRRRSEAAATLREMLEAARFALEVLESEGDMQFDFERGHAVLRKERRGAPTKVLTWIVSEIFDGANPDDWYATSTFDRIRREVAHLIPPEDLPDSLLRGIVRRHVDKTRR